MGLPGRQPSFYPPFETKLASPDFTTLTTGKNLEKPTIPCNPPAELSQGHLTTFPINLKSKVGGALLEILQIKIEFFSYLEKNQIFNVYTKSLTENLCIVHKFLA